MEEKPDPGDIFLEAWIKLRLKGAQLHSREIPLCLSQFRLRCLFLVMENPDMGAISVMDIVKSWFGQFSF